MKTTVLPVYAVEFDLQIAERWAKRPIDENFANMITITVDSHFQLYMGGILWDLEGRRGIAIFDTPLAAQAFADTWEDLLEHLVTH